MPNNYSRIVSAFFMLVICVPQNHAAEEVATKFVPKGMTQRLGGYRPIRAELNETEDIAKKLPEDLTAPKFGWIQVNDQKFAVVLDEPEDGDATLWVDANSDGDLTNDPQIEWKQEGARGVYSGEADLALSPEQSGHIGLYRFDPNDARRSALKDTLLYYLDYGYEFSLKLDDQEFTTVASSLEDAQSLPIDRDANGRISRNYEMAVIGKPFNFTGTTYLLKVADNKLTIEQATEELPQLPMPPDLTFGKPALEFTAETMEGNQVQFPQDYSGRIVMLDFWATWCGPCIGEIPHMKEAYSKWHDQGFDILGISFDQEGQGEKVTKFLEDRELTWPQIFEGKGWDTSLGRMHDVSGIPFVLLVDGDSGQILATARQLRGPGLTDFIGEKLKQKLGDKFIEPQNADDSEDESLDDTNESNDSE